MSEHVLKITPQNTGRRLDICLLELSNKKGLGFSRTSIQKLVLGGKVTVNGAVFLKPNYKVKTADEVRVKIGRAHV